MKIYSPESSSGVQIIGGSSPCRPQILAMALHRSAFAICLQFQVSKESTPWIADNAMCSASSAAFSGTAC